MNIEQVALQLWPCWMLGLMMIYLTWASQYRSLLKVNPSAILKFARILVIIGVLRYLLFHFLAPESIVQSTRGVTSQIPWQALLGVFWEDACFSMPLVLMGMMFDKEKWYDIFSRVALVVVMLAFACGHIYQGYGQALAISLYIPVAMKMGKKYGYGTVMLCHMLYDMSTLLTFKLIAG